MTAPVNMTAEEYKAYLDAALDRFADADIIDVYDLRDVLFGVSELLFKHIEESEESE